MGELGEDVDVSDDHGSLGDQTNWRPEVAERLAAAARQPVGALDRLIGGGRRSERHRLTLPAPAGKLATEQLRHIDLDAHPGAEACPGLALRQLSVGAGAAVDAAVTTGLGGV